MKQLLLLYSSFLLIPPISASQEVGPDSSARKESQPKPLASSSRLTTVGHGARFTRFHLQQLPTARNIWVLLESQAPGVVSDRIDIGGIKSEAPARFGGHGTSWTQNAYYLNGLSVTDPYSGAEPLLYPDYDGLEELDVSTAVHPASVGSP